MLESLKEEVYEANMDLVAKGVVLYTWGNVSGINRERGLFAIKPSGVSYDELKPADIVIVDLESGDVAEGSLRPSSDTPTHAELYRSFGSIGGVTHTHSRSAVAFAQAQMAIPALGTTHADYFYGDIPCARALTELEVEEAYELNTGKVIAETFADMDPIAVPGSLVKGHGPFAWGRDAAESVYHAVVLEETAAMALLTLQLNPDAALEPYVLEKHYQRKHGKNAYYGQVG